MERTNHKRFWKGGLDMANTSQIPVIAERQDGGTAGGNGHHVWTEDEKQAFALFMSARGWSWDLRWQEWVHVEDTMRRPLPPFLTPEWRSAVEQAMELP